MNAGKWSNIVFYDDAVVYDSEAGGAKIREDQSDKLR